MPTGSRANAKRAARSAWHAGMLDRRELREEFGIRANAAIVGYGDLVLDPRRTTLALLRAAAARGVSMWRRSISSAWTPARPR